MSEGFGRGQRLRIGAMVAITALASITVWGLLNFLFTRPRLRTTLDFTRDARFQLSDATTAMIEMLRARNETLEIDTFFMHPRDSNLRAAGLSSIQERVRGATHDLLRRIDYLGGNHVRVEDFDPTRNIVQTRERARELDVDTPNVIVMKVGKRRRKLDVLVDLADIEVPDADRRNPGQAAQPVLRGYKGEEAIASALKGLLAEEKLVAYWYASPGAQTAPFRGPAAEALSVLAREMVADGFENRPLDLQATSRVPSDCTLMVIAGPQGPLPRADEAAIVAYVRGGGRVLMTTHVTRGGIGSGQLSHRHLLQPLGLSLGEQWLFNAVIDPQDPSNFTLHDALCQRIVVRTSGLNGSHPVTRRLRDQGMSVELEFARSLRLADPMPDGVRGEYLLTTNPKAWEVAVPALDQQPNRAIPRDEQLGIHHVAAAIEVAAADGPEAASAKPGRFVLVSGMALRNGDPSIKDGSLIRSNLYFGLYLVNWLVREEGFVAVATRRYRPPVMSIDQAQLVLLDRLLIWGMPGFFLVVSIVLLFWRRRA